MSNPKPLSNVKFIQKCLIINGEGKILALQRAKSDPRRALCWDLPGGQFEEGETVDEHLAREVFEETGIKIGKHHAVYLGSSLGRTSFVGLQVFAVIQVCSDWKAAPSVALAKDGGVVISDEHAAYRWVTYQEFMCLEVGDDGGFFKASVQAYVDSLPAHT